MIYDRFTRLALKQIDDKGREITLLNKHTGGYNPITDEYVAPAQTSKVVRAVFTDYAAKEIDGEIIQRGDKRCLIAGPVDSREIIIDGSDQYAVISVQEVRPGNVLILSKVQVRR